MGWKSFDIKGNKILKSKKKKDVINLKEKFEDPRISAKKLYAEILSTHDNSEKTLRINKIKSELQITNSEIASIFKIIGIDYIDNPNAKLTESEYVFIKTMKEKNI